MIFEEKGSDELSDKLENGVKIEQMLASAGWKLLAEKMKAQIALFEKQLRVVNPSNTNEIIRLQTLCQVLDDIIPSLINNMKQEGIIAFKELEMRKMEE